MRARWPFLGGYLIALILAEFLVGISTHQPDGAVLWQAGLELGLTIHILLLFSVLFLAVLIGESDRPLAFLLAAVSLASLDRILSLAVPRPQWLTLLQWLGLVSIPLLTAAGSVAYVLGIRLKDLGFGPMSRSDIALQGLVGSSGLLLGVAEFAILRPSPDQFFSPQTPSTFVFGVIVLFFATGLAEEVIFRGIMLPRSVEVLGRRSGLLFTTAVFATLHLFYQNAIDLVFVFGVGLFYGFVVLKSKQLWGVTISHTTANVMLYLVAPLLFGLVT